MGAEDTWGKLQKNYKIGKFGGSSIWLQQALDTGIYFQKYLLSSCLCYLNLVNKVSASDLMKYKIDTKPTLKDLGTS